MVEFLKVAQSGRWPQQACTALFFLVPKNVTKGLPMALVPAIIRWREALRAPEVAKWQHKYLVEWDVTDGRNGGAQRIVWEFLMEMERFKFRGGLGSAPGEGDLGLGDSLQFPKEDTAGAVRVLRASEASAVRRMCGGAAPNRHGRLARFQMGLLSEVTKICPPLKLRVFVDDIKALLKRKEQGIGGDEGKVKVEERSGGEGLKKLSITENGKEGRSKMIASCTFLEEKYGNAVKMSYIGRQC